MATEIITYDDLIQFKHDLIKEIKEILNKDSSHSFPKYLRTSDLQKMLGLSASSIQSLRTKGKLPYSKINGTIFYKLEEIQKLITDNKVE